jgi:Na+/H+ antiporter NhaC
MGSEFGIWSLLPPIFAITLAIATRQVLVSLFAGVWIGYLVVNHGNPLVGTVATFDACVAVFRDSGNTSVILFCALVGSLIALVQRSGGVDGFIERASRANLVTGPRSAGILAMVVGGLVFVETSISCLMTGAVARPLFDRMRISREKLAFVCDTASAPVCVLIPINGWGAVILAHLAAAEEVANPLPTLLRAIPLNFYAIFALALLVIVVLTGWDFGPMREAQRRAREEGKLHRDGAEPMISDEVLALKPDPGTPLRALNMIIPLALMVLLVPVALWYTGQRNLPAGVEADLWTLLEAASGSTAVFWAVCAGILCAAILYFAQGIMTVREFVDVSLKGAAALAPLAALMVLAFAIGHLCRYELKTGQYVAQIVGTSLSPWLVAPAIFAVSCFIAFSTGTSFGTFAIMISIATTVAAGTGANMELTLAAVLGGAVFGDHCSPISDTTIVASMASASDHIDHVRTQLPYALAAGAAAFIAYAIAGLFLYSN